MAQGYLGFKQNQELEVVGEEYFDMLAMCSFFLDFIKDDGDNIIACKMHDIVHDFAQFLVKNECFTMGTSSDGESSCSYGNAHHLKMTLEDEQASFPTNIFKLRSLFVEWSFEDSSSLDYLRGSLEIRGLGYVRDGAEAKNANLRSKKYLLHLELYFDYRSEASSTEVSTKDEAVLEALHPTPNLEKLVLNGYRGITMSFDWMGSLTQLKKLTLEDCINCEYLPPLGKLPMLQTLEVRGMRGLKRVGNEFLGIKNNDSSSSSSSLIFFPKLNRLFFNKLENLVDWEYEITKDIAIMPCLSYCEIDHCPKLKALPNHFLQATSLKGLDISDCPVLKQWAEIYHHLPITSYCEKRRHFLETQRRALEFLRQLTI
ncbi:hypothetical protein LWI28_005629 [Acer negundo]|uniref:Uncharacterized protein n=1 Tax=Acer negundo TaxID=4023 RepID=A0AAD5ID61_ACENE|nr:hypothetical protein LWI28_005629 [Acer negundo]